MRRVIIGLVGPSGSGKTTVGKCLVSEYGFTRIHVAQPIKDAFCAAFGCDQGWLDRHVDDTTGFLGGARPRDILEAWGHRLHEIAPEALPRALDATLSGMRRKRRILVDGIRRPREADMVALWHGKVIRIIPYKGIDPAKPCDHTQLDVMADHEIGAGGRVDELMDQLRKLLDDSILSK